MDLSNEIELTELSSIIADFRATAPETEPLVVGAMARDLLLHYNLNVRVTRATQDLDIAFAVADWQEFSRVRNELLLTNVFKPVHAVIHRLVYKTGMPIDLIPFGGVETSESRIVWPADQNIMGVLGYREARDSAIEVTLPMNQSAMVVSLPMLAILKLLAWSDRHMTSPRKDAVDFFLILKNYLKGENSERLYSEAAHLLKDDDFDYEEAGAWLAGYDAAKSIVQYSEHPKRILSTVVEILKPEVDVDGQLRMVGETGVDANYNFGLLISFEDGVSSVIR